MQDKSQSVLFAGMLIVEDHAAISIHCSRVSVLAAYEGKAYRSPIVIRGRCDRSADPAPEPLLVGKAIPINLRRLQPTYQYAAGPVRSVGDRYDLRRNNLAKRFVLRDLDRQSLTNGWRYRGVASPEQHAVIIRISRGDALWVEVAALTPINR